MDGLESKEQHFTQFNENQPAELILIHEPKSEIFMSILHPAASLFEEVTDKKSIKKCYSDLKQIFKQCNIEFITIRDALKKNKESLLQLAWKSISYECDNPSEGGNNRVFLHYISEEYRREVLEKLTEDQLVDILLTRPKIKVKYAPINTHIEIQNISFKPLGNIHFVRDQQITTQRGVVIGSLHSGVRNGEQQILKQVFHNLKIKVIGEIPENSYLEGGDFYVAKEDLCMVGIGMRSTFSAAAYLMENDLLGTDRFALFIDECDFNQIRMHLDSYFNIVNKNTCVLLDFQEVSKISDKYINRRVEVYRKQGEGIQPLPTPNGKEEKYGEYVLCEEYSQIEDFLIVEGYKIIRVSHAEQLDYLINFLNIGNNRIISVCKDLENKIKQESLDVDIFNLDFKAIRRMYGAVHCATQVSRTISEKQFKKTS
jgi:arginine deiminase